MAARLWSVIASALLAGCGHAVPFGERLLPESYGPPFGAALKDNQPYHPHHPASAERYAHASHEEARTFRSHAACHAALEAAVAGHGEHGRVVRISSVESLGHYEEGGEVHEHRCAGPVLSHRSWCRNEAGHAGAGEAHKKAEGRCEGESSAH
jgi:hypothetical protein